MPGVSPRQREKTAGRDPCPLRLRRQKVALDNPDRSGPSVRTAAARHGGGVRRNEGRGARARAGRGLWNSDAKGVLVVELGLREEEHAQVLGELSGRAGDTGGWEHKLGWLRWVEMGKGTGNTRKSRTMHTLNTAGQTPVVLTGAMVPRGCRSLCPLPPGMFTLASESEWSPGRPAASPT